MRAPGDLQSLPRPGALPPSWAVPGASERVGTGAAGGAGVLPFRRRRGVPVRRRRRWLGLLRPLAAALLLVGAPAAALAWSATSFRFALADYAVETGANVEAAWVEERLEPLVGKNLVWMSMRRVERRLADHPWIAGIEVSKVLPDRLRVAIVERRPVARLETPAGAFWVDRRGVVIAPLAPSDLADDEPAADAWVEAGGQEKEAARGALVLRVASAAPAAWTDGERSATSAIDPDLAAALPRALAAAQALSRAAPRWGAALDAVDLLGEEDFILHTAELPFPLLVEPAAVEGRVRRLTDLLPELLRRVPQPAAVDLRFENRIVVRAAALEAERRNDARGELHG